MASEERTGEVRALLLPVHDKTPKVTGEIHRRSRVHAITSRGVHATTAAATGAT